MAGGSHDAARLAAPSKCLETRPRGRIGSGVIRNAPGWARDLGAVAVGGVEGAFRHAPAILVVKPIERHEHEARAHRQAVGQRRQARDIGGVWIGLALDAGGVDVELLLQGLERVQQAVHRRVDPAAAGASAEQVHVAVPHPARIEIAPPRAQPFGFGDCRRAGSTIPSLTEAQRAAAQRPTRGECEEGAAIHGGVAVRARGCGAVPKGKARGQRGPWGHSTAAPW